MTEISSRFGTALRMLDNALAGIPWMVIGGVAVVSRGVPRTTRDLDVAVGGGAVSTEELLATLARATVLPRVPDAAAFAQQSQVLLVRHAASELDIDITLAWSAFEEEALALAPRMRIAGVSVPVARAEDLVVYKVIGGRPIDLQDLDELVALHADQMDLERIGALVAQIAEVLDDPNRLEAWKSALRRAKTQRG